MIHDWQEGDTLPNGAVQMNCRCCGRMEFHYPGTDRPPLVAIPGDGSCVELPAEFTAWAKEHNIE